MKKPSKGGSSVTQKTLVPAHIVELQKLDKKLSKLERKVLFMSGEFKALEDEVRRALHGRR